jgi:hypothetical protein
VSAPPANNERLSTNSDPTSPRSAAFTDHSPSLPLPHFPAVSQFACAVTRHADDAFAWLSPKSTTGPDLSLYEKLRLLCKGRWRLSPAPCASPRCISVQGQAWGVAAATHSAWWKRARADLDKQRSFLLRMGGCCVKMGRFQTLRNAINDATDTPASQQRFADPTSMTSAVLSWLLAQRTASGSRAGTAAPRRVRAATAKMCGAVYFRIIFGVELTPQALEHVSLFDDARALCTYTLAGEGEAEGGLAPGRARRARVALLDELVVAGVVVNRAIGKCHLRTNGCFVCCVSLRGMGRRARGMGRCARGWEACEGMGRCARAWEACAEMRGRVTSHPVPPS